MSDNTDSLNHSNRPLSPHLGIYRWQISMAMSITHRITGVILSAAAVLFVALLWSAAYCKEGFAFFTSLFASGLGKTGLFVLLFAFYFHLCSGIRHLMWDAGKGFDIPSVNRTGVIAIVGAAVLTIWTWCIF